MTLLLRARGSINKALLLNGGAVSSVQAAGVSQQTYSLSGGGIFIPAAGGTVIRPSAVTPNNPFSGLYSANTFASSLLEGVWTSSSGTIAWQATPYTPPGISTFAACPAGSGNIAAVRYAMGLAGGSAPGHIMSSSLAGQNWTQFYGCIYLQPDSAFVGHSAENKVSIISINGHPSYVLAIVGTGSAPLLAQADMQNMSVDSHGSEYYVPNNYSGNTADAEIRRGYWNRIETYVKANTPGTADGVVQIWVTQYNADGSVHNGPTLVTNYTALGIVPLGGNNTWDSGWGEGWYVDPVWGGTGGSVASDMYLGIGYLAVAGAT